MSSGPVSLERLLRLRLVVARVGEGDLAGWWNTKGQLGSLGQSVLRRGFPRTYRFAQARSVFAVAAHRCHDLYHPPGAVTLWQLPAEIEDDFDQAWATWIDEADHWEPFFRDVEECTADLLSEMQRLGLVHDHHVEQLAGLKRSAEQRAVPLPGEFSYTDDDITKLALGFARGENGRPAVPFQSWSEGE